MKNRYFSQLVFSIVLSIISGILSIFYYVEANDFAFGLSLSWTIFNVFRSGYYWNDYSAMAFMLKTMKSYLNDLENILNKNEEK